MLTVRQFGDLFIGSLFIRGYDRFDRYLGKRYRAASRLCTFLSNTKHREILAASLRSSSPALPSHCHFLSFAKIYFLLIISIHFQTFRLRESRHQSLCDASVCAFQVFDWESFAVTVRHYCLQPKTFDSNIEESIISSTSIYFSFIKVDTPCWIKLDVLPALEQGQGNVTQGKGLLVMSCKKKVTCHVTQAVESVSLSHFWCPCHSRLFFRKIFLGLVSSSETAFVQRKS